MFRFPTNQLVSQELLMPFQMPRKFEPLSPDLLRDAREITEYLGICDLV